MGEDNKPIPSVAESVDVSPDKTKYTFHLRDSKWSNGTPVTAAEYAFLFFDIKNAKHISQKQLPINQLGIKALDDKTLEVQLDRPAPYFFPLPFLLYL